jgi:hypothetical protein
MRRGLEEGRRADIPAHPLFPPLRQ